jgi:glyoxylase-like metal-dependent hydrolase (beta-lactamase superfamily II)
MQHYNFLSNTLPFFSAITPPYSTNSYLATLQPIESLTQTLPLLLIDPGFDSLFLFQQQLSWLKNPVAISLTIWLTHSHWDHIAGLHQWLEAFPQAPRQIFLHPEDLPNLRNPGADHLPIPEEYLFPGCHDEIQFIEEGQVLHPFIEDSSQAWRVIHTPGHSPGSVCFYNKELNLLISGDTLFQGTIGNTSFPTSSPRQMGQSLHRLMTLPPETKVLPGHGQPTRVDRELLMLQRMAQHLSKSVK